MSEDNKLRFLPFHAINEFMLPEYRIEVLSSVLKSLEKLSESDRNTINKDIKKMVTVQGFRNSMMAPLPMKIKNAEHVFEKQPSFVADILNGWGSLHQDLRNKVYLLLNERNWKTPDLETDRTKLPGFLTTWPQSETFETLITAYREKYPADPESDNNISLMVVWVSARLPFDAE